MITDENRDTLPTLYLNAPPPFIPGEEIFVAFIDTIGITSDTSSISWPTMRKIMQIDSDMHVIIGSG